MGVQNQIYAHKIKLVGSTKRVVEKSRILVNRELVAVVVVVVVAII